MTPTTQHCPHFGRCGGCTLLDQPIEQQLAHKHARAKELLAPFLNDLEVEITPPKRPPRHDRIALLYPVQRQGRRTVAGIYRRGSHDIEPIGDCRIQHRALTEFGVRMGELLPRIDAEPYDEATGGGFVRALRARLMPGTNELLVGAVVTTLRFAGRDALVEALIAAGTGLRDDQGRKLALVGTALNINARPGNALLGPETIAARGDLWQHDQVAGLRLRVGFASFYQLNRHAEAILYRPALGMLGDVAGLRIVDGYGGVGTFALRLLRQGAAHVTLIENSASACADARTNLTTNGYDDAEVREQAFGAAPLPACDLLLADPPRAGLQAQGTQAILASTPARVLLVSCSLGSLARDLAELTKRYRVVGSRLCDLFPHTEHVEALTLLERR